MRKKGRGITITGEFAEFSAKNYAPWKVRTWDEMDSGRRKLPLIDGV